VTWDGRLDNRADLIGELRDVLTNTMTDVSIVAAAFDHWGTNCLARLIGDWALSIWNPNNQSLLLAKDPIGTRHLYYSLQKDEVTWSTILDPLVQSTGKNFSLCEEYMAGWLSFFPAANLTPYVDIRSVLPLPMWSSAQGSRPFIRIGISIRANRPISAETPNMKSASVQCSPKQSDAGFVRTAQFSRNSAAAWIPPLSSAWRTVSWQAVASRRRVSTQCPTTTIPNLVGTNGPFY